MSIALIIPIILLPSFIVVIAISFPYANALTDNEGNVVEIDAKPLFKGADGEIKLMGVVHNTGGIPLEVVLGVNTTTTGDSTKKVVMEEAAPYSSVLYPYSVAPFKFSIKSPDPKSEITLTEIGKPFIISTKKLTTPNYEGLIDLNYTNIPSGENASLVGTVSNSGPFELHDVAVYASAHDKDKKQVDSVVSNIIPNLKPGQQVAFTATPDPNSEGKIIYYSCAGVDLNPQMQKLTIGNNKVLHYDFEGLVAIIDLKYDNSSDSMVFGVKHYNPDGGHMAIKMASKEYSGSENPLSLMLDGKDLTIDGTATTNDNGDVLTMDFVVPPKEHKIQISGINDLAS